MRTLLLASCMALASPAWGAIIQSAPMKDKADVIAITINGERRTAVVDVWLAVTVTGTCILWVACLVVIIGNLLWRVTQH
jgi:hypothetical protein